MKLFIKIELSQPNAVKEFLACKNLFETMNMTDWKVIEKTVGCTITFTDNSPLGDYRLKETLIALRKQFHMADQFICGKHNENGTWLPLH